MNTGDPYLSVSDSAANDLAHSFTRSSVDLTLNSGGGAPVPVSEPGALLLLFSGIVLLAYRFATSRRPANAAIQGALA